jgi:hypothetical protein
MLRAALGALVKSVRRDLAGFASLKTNNFFLFVALLIGGALQSGVEPVSSYPFLLALGGLMLFPASGDPLEKIPRVRLALWPLAGSARATLRLISLALNPAVVLMVVLLVLRAKVWMSLGFLALVTGVRVGAWQLPNLSGRTVSTALLPGMIVNNLRQMLTVLDTYLALAIGAGGDLWRLLSVHPDPSAYPILSLLAAIALSTYAQCLFALDGDSGRTRYRLLPSRGWRILAAKDAAFLIVLLVAVLPLAIVPGLTFGLAALALGRYPSLYVRLPQQRGRFTSGRVLWGCLQGLVGAILGFAGAIAMAAALYGLSLWWAGRQWDHDRRL